MKHIKSIEEIKNSSNESLENCLITLDGAGKLIKSKILKEIIKREVDKALSNAFIRDSTSGGGYSYE